MMMALAAMHDLPCVLVPGGVTLLPDEGEDAGRIQTIGARFAHGQISLEQAAELGCRACASPAEAVNSWAPPRQPKSLAKPWDVAGAIPRSRHPATQSGSTWPVALPERSCKWNRAA